MFTQDQMELLALIQTRNAETQAWVDAAPNRWASFIADDLDFWARVGITSVAQFRRDELVGFISDASKEAYGFRMRRDWDSMSMADLESLADSISEELERQVAREREEQAQASVRFETLVAETIQLGAADRDTALRWIMESSEANGDWEYLCHCHNLPYSYFKEAA